MKRLHSLISHLSFFAVSALCLLICGCAASQNTAEAPSGNAITQTATPTPTPEPTPIPYSLDLYETDDTEDLYDLSEFLDPFVLEEALREGELQPTGDDETELLEDVIVPPIRCAAAGMYSKEEILLVLEENEETYQCVLFDTETGEFSLYEDSWQRAEADKQDTAHNPLQMLSASPLVFYDDLCSVIYRPEAEEPDAVVCPLSSDLLGSSITVANDNIYLSTWSGFVYSFDSSGFPALVWTLPEDYIECYMEDSGRDDVLTFRSTLLADRDQEVHLEVSPDTWAVEVYTEPEETAVEMPRISSDSVYCELVSGEAPAVHLYDTEQSLQKELALPESVTHYPQSLGKLLLTLPNVPVCDDALLLTRTDTDGYLGSLFYWDTAQAETAAWEQPERTSYAPVTVDYGDVSLRAKELGDLYDVSIHIGENTPSDYSTYTAVPSTDTWTITTALDALEAALSKYPPGYFTQLANGVYREIRFELVGPMTPTAADSNIQGPSAVTFDEGGLAQLAFDIEMGIDVGTVCHELTHVFDYRLETLGLLDEEAWAALNPEGFDYYYSYIDSEGNDHQYDEDQTWTSFSEETWGGNYDNVYFYDNYAKTYPTEDRARIIEMLSFPDYTDPCFTGVHLRQKAQYLLDLMRQSFDTAEWPEKTTWELALERA